ncbi:hypothetical protein [Mesorhizobium sp. ES1-1]|uniref:DUF4760 domain-containing protein n=1 Tax=Mesorhizobium sp. ES1-1 TaxID=2876629 RepID=UPI001CC96CD8|nr:hypothetical protein [Mesorhizobium sp. ES1-1]MBZ9677365.1 hypothetical protein [Mesorhizobium sp. ES1-1]
MKEPKPKSTREPIAQASPEMSLAISGRPERKKAPPPVEVPKKDANPFTDGDWRTIIDAWAGLGVRFVLIIGALFSVVQYLQSREEQRVSQSMGLVELWETPDYQKAQQSLKARLAALNEKYSSLLGANPTAAEEKVYRQRIGIEAMSATGGDEPLGEFSADFDKVLYFLNRLSFCVEGNVCSREVADAYFHDYAVSFWSYFAGYIDRQRKAGSTTFAKAVEKYVGTASSSSPN